MKAVILVILSLLLTQPAFAQSAFAPGGNTVNLAVTTATARVQVQTSAANRQMRLYNGGATLVFVACGDVGVVASLTTSLPLAVSADRVITCPQQYIAAISTATSTLYITPGSGGL